MWYIVVILYGEEPYICKSKYFIRFNTTSLIILSSEYPYVQGIYCIYECYVLAGFCCTFSVDSQIGSLRVTEIIWSIWLLYMWLFVYMLTLDVRHITPNVYCYMLGPWVDTFGHSIWKFSFIDLLDHETHLKATP